MITTNEEVSKLVNNIFTQEQLRNAVHELRDSDHLPYEAEMLHTGMAALSYVLDNVTLGDFSDFISTQKDIWLLALESNWAKGPYVSS